MAYSNIPIGVIGGSGLDSISEMRVLGETFPETPYGLPSSRIKVCELGTTGIRIAFLARHGIGHTINPSEINFRANIAALKHIGVQVILAFSAVGSLVEEIEPGHMVIPDQIIDMTKGLRPSTFFENGIVGHVPFSDPFHPPLANLIMDHAEKHLHTHKTLVCMEGPAFSTRAESLFYKQILKAHLINMSAVPEAKLAREAEIAYQMICLVTDYDCWWNSEESVTVESVMATMTANKNVTIALLQKVLPDLEKAIVSRTYKGKNFFDGVENVSKFAVMTAHDKIHPDAADRIKYILPNYLYTST